MLNELFLKAGLIPDHKTLLTSIGIEVVRGGGRQGDHILKDLLFLFKTFPLCDLGVCKAMLRVTRCGRMLTFNKTV